MNGKKTRFTSDNAAEMGRRGGSASGQSRQYAKRMKIALERELDKTTTTKSGESINGREALAMTIMREALKGNVRAMELLLKLMDEFPADKHELSGVDGSPLTLDTVSSLQLLTEDQRALLLSIGEKLLNG